MYTISRFDQIGQDAAVTINNSASEVTAFGSSPSDRQGLTLTNCDATAYVYLSMASGSSAPDLSVASFHFKLGPGADKTIQCGKGVKVYAINDTSPNANTVVRVVELR